MTATFAVGSMPEDVADEAREQRRLRVPLHL